MHRRVLVVATSIALLAAACGGGGTDRTYSCPEGGDEATVRMIEEYDESTGIGLIFEVQYDGVDQLEFPDIDIAEWVITSAVWN